MGLQSETLLYVLNNVPSREGTTRYQHAERLCDSFRTTILCRGSVPREIESTADDVHSFRESRLGFQELFFPLWLVYMILRHRSEADVTIVSPHSLYLLATYVGTGGSSSALVVDLWDDLTLPIASYKRRDDYLSKAGELYHRVLFSIARRCLAKVDLMVLSIHPGIVEKYDLRSVPTIELTNGYLPELETKEVNAVDGPETRFVYLGRANAKRGIDTVVRTVAEACSAGHLDVVGPTDGAVRQVAAGYDNVTLHGAQPHQTAIEIVARADVGLCLLDVSIENYRYSYPIKLFEYAALGRTIVASDTPAIRSILTDRKSVVLVDNDSTQEIQRAIETIAADSAYRQTLGENASTEIEQYAWPSILDRYTEAIESLARGERPTGWGTNHPAEMG